MGKTTLTEFILVIGLIIVYLTTLVISHWSNFFGQIPFQNLEKIYSVSQYVWGDRHTIEMSDEEIYTYAGTRYVQGEDVTKVEFSHPPLAKYLYGISYLLSGNPNWILLPLLSLGFWLLWLISKSIIPFPFLRIMTLFLIMVHTAWMNASAMTMLDLPLTIGIIIHLYLYAQLIQKPNKYIFFLFGIMSGALCLIKYPFPLTFLYLIFSYIGLYLNKFSLKSLIQSGIITLITYLLGYTSFFTHGHSFKEYLAFEWWRFHWFMGKAGGLKFQFLRMVFTGTYEQVWYFTKTIVTVVSWNIIWPLLFLSYLLSWTKTSIRVKNILLPYQLWILCTICIYLIGAPDERFMVPLIPGFVLCTLQAVSHIIESKYPRLTRETK